MTGDPLIYDDSHGYYIGHLGDEGDDQGWFRWPAKQDGWAERKACPAPTDSSDVVELPSFNARLALRLSGVSES